jgi:hypothetical protein
LIETVIQEEGNWHMMIEGHNQDWIYRMIVEDQKKVFKTSTTISVLLVPLAKMTVVLKS